MTARFATFVAGAWVAGALALYLVQYRPYLAAVLRTLGWPG